MASHRRWLAQLATLSFSLFWAALVRAIAYQLSRRIFQGRATRRGRYSRQGRLNQHPLHHRNHSGRP